MTTFFPHYVAFLPLIAALAGSCGDSSTGPNGEVHERWYQSQPGYGRARPTVIGTTVFFGTGDGQVIARDINSGVALWTAKVSNSGIKGANLIVRANILVAPSVFHTVGLDAQTGRQLWEYRAPNDTVGVPVGSVGPGTVIDSRIDADNDMVFIPAWGASVSAVDLRTGTLRWVWQPGTIAGDTATSGVFASGSTGVRISGDTVFASLWHFTNRAGGYSEAWLVAIAKDSGAEIWRVKLPFVGSGVVMQAAPALYQNLVILHTISARTYAIDRSTRAIAWEFTAPTASFATSAGPEVSGDVVYVDGGDGHIWALQASNGVARWKGMFGTATISDMLVTARHIIFSTGAELHILDRETGNQNWVVTQPHTSDPLFGSPSQFANGLVFTTVAGAAWCFDDP
jgi:outer membrane protein assembly factor BamB